MVVKQGYIDPDESQHADRAMMIEHQEAIRKTTETLAILNKSIRTNMKGTAMEMNPGDVVGEEPKSPKVRRSQDAMKQGLTAKDIKEIVEQILGKHSRKEDIRLKEQKQRDDRKIALEKIDADFRLSELKMEQKREKEAEDRAAKSEEKLNERLFKKEENAANRLARKEKEAEDRAAKKQKADADRQAKVDKDFADRQLKMTIENAKLQQKTQKENAERGQKAAFYILQLMQQDIKNRRNIQQKNQKDFADRQLKLTLATQDMQRKLQSHILSLENKLQLKAMDKVADIEKAKINADTRMKIADRNNEIKRELFLLNMDERRRVMEERQRQKEEARKKREKEEMNRQSIWDAFKMLGGGSATSGFLLGGAFWATMLTVGATISKSILDFHQSWLNNQKAEDVIQSLKDRQILDLAKSAKDAGASDEEIRAMVSQQNQKRKLIGDKDKVKLGLNWREYWRVPLAAGTYVGTGIQTGQWGMENRAFDPLFSIQSEPERDIYIREKAKEMQEKGHIGFFGGAPTTKAKRMIGAQYDAMTQNRIDMIQSISQKSLEQYNALMKNNNNQTTNASQAPATFNQTNINNVNGNSMPMTPIPVLPNSGMQRASENGGFSHSLD